MSEVRIHLYASGGPDFATSDPTTLSTLRRFLGPADDHLVMAQEFARDLFVARLDLWAARLGDMEEAHLASVLGNNMSDSIPSRRSRSGNQKLG